MTLDKKAIKISSKDMKFYKLQIGFLFCFDPMFYKLLLQRWFKSPESWAIITILVSEVNFPHKTFFYLFLGSCCAGGKKCIYFWQHGKSVMSDLLSTLFLSSNCKSFLFMKRNLNSKFSFSFEVSTQENCLFLNILYDNLLKFSATVS